MTTTRIQHVWWFITGGVAIVLLAGVLVALPQVPKSARHILALAVAPLVAILLVDLPVCFLILIGHPPVMTLSPLVPSAEERARWRELRERPWLDDEAFWVRFYAGTDIPTDIPLRLRKVYAEQVCMDKVWPADNAWDYWPDIDLAKLIYEIEDEFGIKFSKEAMRQLDGSFDSIVQYLARQRGNISAAAP